MNCVTPSVARMFPENGRRNRTTTQQFASGGRQPTVVAATTRSFSDGRLMLPLADFVVTVPQSLQTLRKPLS